MEPLTNGNRVLGKHLARVEPGTRSVALAVSLSALVMSEPKHLGHHQRVIAAYNALLLFG